MEERKRERSTNYTPQEVSLLIELLCKYKSIISSKETDKVSNKRKDIAWRRITSEFNARSGEEPRSIKTLRQKFDGLKKILKKKSPETLSESEQNLISPLNDDDSEKVIYPDFEEEVGDDIEIPMYSSEEVEHKIGIPIIQHTNDTEEQESNMPVSAERRNRLLKKRRYQDPKSLRSTLSKVLNTSSDETVATRTDVAALEHTIAVERLEQLRQLFDMKKQNMFNEERRRDEELEMKRIEHQLRIEHMVNEERRKNEEHEMRMRQKDGQVTVWQ